MTINNASESTTVVNNFCSCEVERIEQLTRIRVYAEELARTDYRGNPPVEHYVAAKLLNILGVK